MPLSPNSSIDVGIRPSKLSRAQLREIAALCPQLSLKAAIIETMGDRDRAASLRELEKSNFFTREIDEALLEGRCRIAVHSAKDLPEPLPEGLAVAALTQGLDPSDLLVLRQGDTPEELPAGARIATSSFRRELAVRSLRHDLSFVQIRGNVDERLRQLEKRRIDGLVVASAALMRLGLTELNTWRLPGEAAPLQGKLAIIAREGDWEMRLLFALIDSRPLHRVLYTGLDPTNYLKERSCTLFHYPTIQTQALNFELQELSRYTHIIFTSKTAIRSLPALPDVTYIAVGRATAQRLPGKRVLIAEEESAEGVVTLLETLDLAGARILWPHSRRSRSLIADYLVERGIAFDAPAVYDTLSHQPFAPPNLDCIDEIVFTSPSTVDGFLELYPALPSGKLITAQGTVTEEYTASRCAAQGAV